MDLKAHSILDKSNLKVKRSSSCQIQADKSTDLKLTLENHQSQFSTPDCNISGCAIPIQLSSSVRHLSSNRNYFAQSPVSQALPSSALQSIRLLLNSSALNTLKSSSLMFSDKDATLPEEESEFENSPNDRILLPPDLNSEFSSIMENKDAFDSNEFDPIEHINITFTNEQSLSTIDTVLEKMKEQIFCMEKELRDLVRSQTNSGQMSKETLEHVENSIRILVTKIAQIKESAKQSEIMVHEITRDIKSLDQSKKNLTISVTVLKRLRLLVAAVEQMRVMGSKHQYLECCQLIQVIQQLLVYFKQYRTVHRISTLYESVLNSQTDLKRQIMREFEGAFSSGVLKTQYTQLGEACAVINVMEPEAKKQLIDWYCDLQLKDYRGIFRNNPEVAGLDNVGRRHAWLKRLLKLYDEEHASLFPLEWRVAEFLCDKFCQDTRKDLSEVLAKSDNNMDVKLMLQSLQSTIEFEQKLDRRFNSQGLVSSFEESDERQSEEQLTPINFNEGKRSDVYKFSKSMSEAFEPYLRHHISAED
ncbi:Vacuolar protein sorting-associated protein 53, partial [Nowakowskiella sp. JEL0078]